MSNHDRKAEIAAWLEKPKRYKRTVFFDDGPHITIVVSQRVGDELYRWADSVSLHSLVYARSPWRKLLALSIRRVRTCNRRGIERPRLTKPTMPG